MRIVILGLAITSSWGNGHATNYRALMRQMHERGHDVLFCERDAPWYASRRDLPRPPWGRTSVYSSLEELRRRHSRDVGDADLVVVGSYVRDGPAVAHWALETTRGVTAFYDIDTPITLAKLARSDEEYLTAELVGRFDLYLSFTGGPTLDVLRREYGARRPIAFYCLVDPRTHAPRRVPMKWDLGYLGTYGEDRQAQLEALLIEPARRAGDLAFAVAGPQYPPEIEWAANIERIEHLPPSDHPSFYCGQRFTLNITRADMRRSGWSPSVRLFEAAACGVPVISDRWDGLDSILTPGEEILLADGPGEVLRILTDVDDASRREIGRRGRRRVLAEHTAAHRVELLETEVSRLHNAETRAA
jgi:spore maturation protein CgeB